MPASGNLSGFGLVAIGSKNPAKTLGVRNVFSAVLPRVRFVEVDAHAVARVQPLTLGQTLDGAKKRARFAIEESHADVAVGVEAGIVRAGGSFLNLQLAVVMDRADRSSVGSSAGFMLPRRVVVKMLKDGSELDSHSHEITGIWKVKNMDGIISHLSRGSVTRVEMTEQCVRMALVPWLNKRLYGH